MDLDDFEIQVLRACAGLSNTLNGWGAAVGEAASALKHRGLLEGHYRITDAGRAFLATLVSSQAKQE